MIVSDQTILEMSERLTRVETLIEGIAGRMDRGLVHERDAALKVDDAHTRISKLEVQVAKTARTSTLLGAMAGTAVCVIEWFSKGFHL